MIQDIQKVQSEIENNYIKLQPQIEQTAVDLHNQDPETLTRYLTDYSVTHAEDVVVKWRDLGEFLIMKYNDGYVKNEKGRPEGIGYPSEWLRKVIESRPEQFKLPIKKDPSVPESKLID